MNSLLRICMVFCCVLSSAFGFATQTPSQSGTIIHGMSRTALVDGIKYFYIVEGGIVQQVNEAMALDGMTDWGAWIRTLEDPAFPLDEHHLALAHRVRALQARIPAIPSNRQTRQPIMRRAPLIPIDFSVQVTALVASFLFLMNVNLGDEASN
jgi:hypothetical protein